MLRRAASTMIPAWTWVMSRRFATTPIRSAFVIAVRAGSTMSEKLRSLPGVGPEKTADSIPANPPKSRKPRGIAASGHWG